MHTDTISIRRKADNLFRPPDAEAGSNADKLQALRQRLQRRQREQRLCERQTRQEKRTERQPHF